MRGIFSLLGLVLALGIGMFVYRTYFLQQPSATGVNDVTGSSQDPVRSRTILTAKGDLMKLAETEFDFRAANGRFADLGELKGEHIDFDPRGRLGYSYSVDITDQGFVITATYHGPESNMPTLTVDQLMNFREQ